MDNAEEPTKRGMIGKERLFVATTVRQGTAVCGNKAMKLAISTCPH